MRDRQKFAGNLRDSPFNKIYQMRPFLAWSISLDSNNFHNSLKSHRTISGIYMDYY